VQVEACKELQDFERNPESRYWEDWLDYNWNQYDGNLESGEDGWYEALLNWDKDGVRREPPMKSERGIKWTSCYFAC